MLAVVGPSGGASSMERETYADGVHVWRGSGIPPESDEAQEVFSTLLKANPEAVPTTFPFHLDASTVLEPHRHNADVAAGVVEGHLIFGVGMDLAEEIDVGPGDYIIMPESVPHAERSGAGAMRAIIGCLRTFNTTPL